MFAGAQAGDGVPGVQRNGRGDVDGIDLRIAQGIAEIGKDERAGIRRGLGGRAVSNA